MTSLFIFYGFKYTIAVLHEKRFEKSHHQV